MFRFKQFSVEDDRSSMKVGTDAVLLGAYAAHPAPRRILDIGTGCGLIALMLAQRFPRACVDAIDLDAASVAQARGNFARSPWASRMSAIEMPLQAYHAAPYDLIVSNPPYFTASLRNPDPRRAQARHNDTLPLADLLLHASRLLAPVGRLSVILPIDESQRLESLAPSHGLATTDALIIQNRADLPPKRRILTLSSHAPFPVSSATLILHTPDGHRTPAHHALTEAFYL